MKKPALMTVQDAYGLDTARINELAVAHMNPGQIPTLKLLGFERVVVDRAEGMYYTDQSGRRILDFFGAFGALAFGHNHPRILAARADFARDLRHELAIAFLSQYAATLSYDLAQVAPDDLGKPVVLGVEVPQPVRVEQHDHPERTCDQRTGDEPHGGPEQVLEHRPTLPATGRAPSRTRLGAHGSGGRPTRHGDELTARAPSRSTRGSTKPLGSDQQSAPEATGVEDPGW